MVAKSPETGVETISSPNPSVSRPQFTHLLIVQIPTTDLEGLFQVESPTTNL